MNRPRQRDPLVPRSQCPSCGLFNSPRVRHKCPHLKWCDGSCQACKQQREHDDAAKQLKLL